MGDSYKQKEEMLAKMMLAYTGCPKFDFDRDMDPGSQDDIMFRMLEFAKSDAEYEICITFAKDVLESSFWRDVAIMRERDALIAEHGEDWYTVNVMELSI